MGPPGHLSLVEIRIAGFLVLLVVGSALFQHVAEGVCSFLVPIWVFVSICPLAVGVATAEEDKTEAFGAFALVIVGAFYISIVHWDVDQMLVFF